MSDIPYSCSLHEILQTPCGSSRDEENPVSLSECNSDISAHLASCHLSKFGDVTEAELILARAGIRGLSATQLASMKQIMRHFEVQFKSRDRKKDLIEQLMSFIQECECFN